MREDYGNMTSLVEQEEGFGDMGFGADGQEILRHASRLDSPDQVRFVSSTIFFFYTRNYLTSKIIYLHKTIYKIKYI